MEIKRPGSFGLHAQEDRMSGKVKPDVRPTIPATDESFLEDRQSGDATFEEQVRRDEQIAPSVPTMQKPQPRNVDKGLIDTLL